MVFRGARSLLAPASRATSSLVSTSRSISTVTAGSTKKTAAKTKAKAKAKPKPKAKSESPAKKTPRSTGLFKVTPVSPVLAQFLGTGETTRTDAIKGIWTYIKSHDLQVHNLFEFVVNFEHSIIVSELVARFSTF